MIAAWMIYATLVAALACLAAMTAERALRLGKRPARWVWIGAMTFAGVIPLVATRRSPVMIAPATATSAYGVRSGAASVPEDNTILRPMPSAVAVASSATLLGLNRPLIVVWIAGSLLWILILAASAVRVTHRRRRWTESVLDGKSVLISRDDGPAVVGIIRPRIVIPAWVSTLAPEQRALVLSHEHEHARARDPLLIATGALALVAMPWNASLWYALRRLRLAVEVDCDYRVLRTHPDVRAYGSLLVDVTERNLTSAMHLAALGDSRSELARRLALLTSGKPRHLAARIFGATVLCLTCVVVACKAPKPASVAQDSGATASHRLAVATRPDSQTASAHDSAGRDTLMPVTGEFIATALEELAIRPDSMLTPADVRKLARFVRGRRIVSEASNGASSDEPPPVPVAVIRRAVETHYPTAFGGHLGGGKHYYWFLGDRANHVLGFASGREGLGVDALWIQHRGQPPEQVAATRDAITWGSVVRMVPGTPTSMQRRGDRLQSMLFPNGADTVVAVWARLWGESSAK